MLVLIAIFFPENLTMFTKIFETFIFIECVLHIEQKLFFRLFAFCFIVQMFLSRLDIAKTSQKHWCNFSWKEVLEILISQKRRETEQISSSLSFFHDLFLRFLFKCQSREETVKSKFLRKQSFSRVFCLCRQLKGSVGVFGKFFRSK